MRGGIFLCVMGVVGCLGGCKQDMDRQPRLSTYERAEAFANHSAARPLPSGVVARGDLARHEAEKNPPPITQKLIGRGRERFDIFCSPCHGRAGHGDGIIVARGFPKPPSLLEPRLLGARAQHFFDVITNGHGVMYPYAARVEPADRWAIVAYVRALQLSQTHDPARSTP